MKEVVKKIEPEYFEKVVCGDKKFELRVDEDEAQAGDLLVLYEWDVDHRTGRVFRTVISYVLRNVPEYGLKPGHCIIGWK